MKSSDIVLILAAIIFPPVSTFLVCGCGPDLLIGILLCIFGYLPGAIHALWLIYRKLEAEERFGVDGFVCGTSVVWCYGQRDPLKSL
ncbi:hypothetical protein GGX14DRAFT_456015, partial [Mycena pura]